MVNVDGDLTIDEEVLDDSVEEEIVETSNNLEEESESDPESIQDEDVDDDEEDRIVTIGDEEAEAPEGEEAEDHKEAPSWVKKVRKKNREFEKENKRLKRQLEELSKPPEKDPVELGEKPTLAASNYDANLFEQKLNEYNERKREVEKQAAAKAEEVEKLNKKWQDKQDRYVNLRKEHGFKDFEDAEDYIDSTFSQRQKGFIIHGADDSALLMYALGKNPKIAEELSKIDDPVEFTWKVAKVESQLKVISRKPPAPEKRVGAGKSGSTGSADKVLARLEAEADRTGDRTKVSAYRRQLRDKG